MKFKNKICKMCGKNFTPTGMKQFYCGTKKAIGTCSHKNNVEKHNIRNKNNYLGFQKMAFRRGKEVSLSKEKFIELKHTKECHYCHRIDQKMTIDRKDNQLGYSDDNCVAACHFCNSYKKERYSYEKMLKIGKFIPAYARIKNEITKIVNS